MAEMKTYQGGCHCKAVRWETQADISEVMECNCSHCAMKGLLMAFAPAESFTLLSGEDALTEYRFHKKTISHLFCSLCGVQSFGKGAGPDGAEMAAINVRCIDDVDLAALNRKAVDGKTF